MIKLATVFSGIGSIEWALKRLKVNHEIVFACDNGERYLTESFEDISKQLVGKTAKEVKQYIEKIYDQTGRENFVQKTYQANYNVPNDRFYQDIRFIDGKEFCGEIDLFVGGSPCQSFSISGKRAGFEDARGTLFYDYARLVKEAQPKVFIFENVPGLLSHDKGNTWKVISEIFDSLGYVWQMRKLRAVDYGIPQNRSRVYVVGFRKDLVCGNFEFPKKQKLTKTVQDFLDKEVDKSYYHGEKGFKWVTKEKSLEKRVSINESISRTQAANQQFNWCGDMVFRPIEECEWAKNENDIYIGEFKGKTGVCRKLTPMECLRLMGYDDNFKIVVPDKQMYRQSGNSIVVNVMERIMEEIIKTGVFNEQ